MRRLRAAITPARLVLALILLAGLALRVWHNGYGLPFVWGIDEGTHFTSRSVQMFREGFDPSYYQNPSAYTYLVYALLRVMYGPLGSVFDLRFGNVSDQFNKDPTQIWIAARSLAAVLCMAGVAGTYVAARRIWGTREGLVAAAVLAFAFLPVAYSRVAVTDVGALLGVALSIWGAIRAREEGRLVHFALAGAAAGLALSFKYTAGLALLPLGIAALARLRMDRGRALLGLALAAACALAVFVVLNPYLLLNFHRFVDDLHGQADVTANEPKPGQESGGVSYYLHSLTWGLGWAAGIAALAGAVIELRRDVVRGLMLMALPVALFAYLSVQSRYFGRWLLPAYPLLAMLAAVALVRAADLLPLRPAARAAALGAVCALVLAQPLAADLRTGAVLGRDDTRQEARDFLTRRFAPELRVSIEPAVPGRYFRLSPKGRDPASVRRCARRDDWKEAGWDYPTQARRRVCAQYKPGQFARPDGGVRASAYHLVLGPRVIDDYRFYGYCLVMTFGVVRERAVETRDPGVRAYYKRLERESDLLRVFSPYDSGSGPVPFSFDLSYNYYPIAYHRPGPVTRIYRLRGCRQAYGAPVIQVPRARELPPFAPRRNEPGTAGDEL
jgi:dolichyl-phosphate-mannose-protein mannosyltransferase